MSLFHTEAAVTRPGVRSPHRVEFIRRVYTWLAIAMLVTGGGSFLSIRSGLTERIFFEGNGAIMLLLAYLLWVGLGKGLEAVQDRPGLNVALFFVFSVYTGFFISGFIVVAMVIGGAVTGSPMTFVYMAVGMLVLVFLSLTLYAFMSRRVTFVRGLFVVSAVALVCEIVMSRYVDSSAIGLMVTYGLMVAMGGFALWKTDNVMNDYTDNEYITGAMHLYLAYVLIFVWFISESIRRASNRDDDD